MDILRSLPRAKPNLDPIEWKPYEGEMVNTVLTIRKGKKIQETEWYEDSYKLLTGKGLELKASGDGWLRQIYRQMIKGRWL